MSTTTTNYKLFKPELSDPADITKMNPNWDTIDAELYKKATLGADGRVLPEQLPEKAKSFEVVVPTSGWSNNSTIFWTTINVNGMTSDINPIYGLKPIGNYITDKEEEAFALIKGLLTSNGSVIIFASEVPTTSITLTLKEV
jgi:hypothetical protein